MDFKTRVFQEALRQGFNLLNWDTIEHYLAHRPWDLRTKERQGIRDFEFQRFKTWREGHDHPYNRREQHAYEETFKKEKEKEEKERMKMVEYLWKEFDEQGDYDPDDPLQENVNLATDIKVSR